MSRGTDIYSVKGRTFAKIQSFISVLDIRLFEKGSCMYFLSFGKILFLESKVSFNCSTLIAFI